MDSSRPRLRVPYLGSPMSLKNESLIGRQFRLSHLKSNMSCLWGKKNSEGFAHGPFRYLLVTFMQADNKTETPLPSPREKKTSWLLSKSLLISGLSSTKYYPQLLEICGLANFSRMRKPELKFNPFLTRETRRSWRRGSAIVCNPNFHSLHILNLQNYILIAKYLNLRN